MPSKTRKASQRLRILRPAEYKNIYTIRRLLRLLGCQRYTPVAGVPCLLKDFAVILTFTLLMVRDKNVFPKNLLLKALYTDVTHMPLHIWSGPPGNKDRNYCCVPCCSSYRLKIRGLHQHRYCKGKYRNRNQDSNQLPFLIRLKRQYNQWDNQKQAGNKRDDETCRPFS